MHTHELMTGQTLYFYARSGTRLILQEGQLFITLRDMQMDGYGWKEEIKLIGCGELTLPRSGWTRIDARQRALIYIAEPQPLMLDWWIKLKGALRVFRKPLTA